MFQENYKSKIQLVYGVLNKKIDNNNYIMEEYPKNSLLGQLEQKGFLEEDNQKVDYLPFGVLTGGVESSPFVKKVDDSELKPEPKIIQKRLNDLDANIFQEGNYLDIQDSELTKEEKINKLKKMMKKLDEKIFMLEDSDDEILMKKLNDEKEALEEAVKLLEGDVDNLFISNKLLAENLSVAEFASKMHIKEKLREIEKFIFKFCPILHKCFLVRHALNKLVMLNESAKELLMKKIPYGEQEIRYSDFIAYLSCANVIHAKLTKKM